MGEKSESPEERIAALQVEVAGIVDQCLEQNNQGGLTMRQKDRINMQVSQALFGPSFRSRDVHVEDFFVLDIGSVNPGTGRRRGVKSVDVGSDGKPLRDEYYGGLPASLADIKEGDRVVVVGLSSWVDIPEYGAKFGEPTWILAKKVETKD